jgi:hypothetical protein
VIPRIPSVIVLDELPLGTPEVDEPWEYVSDDEESEPISYAKIVAAAD